VLLERGLFRHGMVQASMIEALQKCSDFKVKWEGQRAYNIITEFMRERGHAVLFGVKYHAELAYIERLWMWEKQQIRPHLNGTLPKLTKLLHKAHCAYRLSDAWKAARHCRDTMHAYQHLAEHQLSLSDLDAAEQEYKSHRCVVDSVDGMLKQRSKIALTAHETKMLERTKVRRQNDIIREKSLTQHHADVRSFLRRKQRFDKKKQ
jgi:hypothetical protein